MFPSGAKAVMFMAITESPMSIIREDIVRRNRLCIRARESQRAPLRETIDVSGAAESFLHGATIYKKMQFALQNRSDNQCALCLAFTRTLCQDLS